MPLYKTNGGAWRGTEADARDASRAEGGDGRKGSGWHARDMPSGKAELLALLNEAAGSRANEPAQIPQPGAAPEPGGAFMTLADQVQDMAAPQCAAILAASLDRMGELGPAGQEALARLKFGRGRGTAFYRGFAIVALVSAFD